MSSNKLSPYLQANSTEDEIDELMVEVDHTQDGDLHITPEDYKKLAETKSYLIDNFAGPPTIKQLARIVTLNEFKLKNYFKEVFQITIHSFIIKLRMEEANKILAEDHTVNEVALKVGYRSVSHFISMYKSYYGKTPMQANKSKRIKKRC